MVDDRGHGAETELNRAPPEATSPRGVPRITAIHGPGAGQALAMADQMATVGRHPTNDLVLDDPKVSGVHLQLRRLGGRLHIRDDKSTNGTWLGPHRIRDGEVGAGAEITVGNTLLRVDVDTAASPAPISGSEAFGALVGRSLVMRELFATLERLAPKELSILIQGETGTGKEEVARALHARSPRAGRPFIVIDAGSLPESMAEVVLFGSESGPYGEPHAPRMGRFEVAQGGTVLIDEIGELSPSLQAKFLRVLERHEVMRVGGQQPIHLDIRVIAATSRDLRHEIEGGRFREDLYFRIAPVRLMLPPLRDRPEDVPLICQKLLREIAGERMLLLEADALAHLQLGAWPGNVRELRNVLLRAAALTPDDVIRRTDVSTDGGGFRGSQEERMVLDVSGTFGAAKDRAVERFESTYLTALMTRCAGNLSMAAREADLARHYLRDILKKRGLYGVSWDGKDEREKT